MESNPTESDPTTESAQPPRAPLVRTAENRRSAPGKAAERWGRPLLQRATLRKLSAKDRAVSRVK